jgi:hypothetical protein
MLRRVAVVRSSASKESSALIMMVTTIGELGSKLAIISNRHTPRRNIMRIRRLLATAHVLISPILAILMMEALLCSEASVIMRATRRNIPEHGILDFIESLEIRRCWFAPNYVERF